MGGERYIFLPYLHHWRFYRLLSQEELSNVCDPFVSASSIGKLERQENAARVSTVGILAQALECTREELVRTNPIPDQVPKKAIYLPYLRQWKQKRIMSSMELCMDANIAPETLYYLERTKKKARMATIGYLADALHISRHELVYTNPLADKKSRVP